jgi:archaemetzincin
MKHPTKKIYIVGVGYVEDRILMHLSSLLEQRLDMEFVIGEEISLPEGTFDVKRGQCNSTQILAELERHTPEEVFRLLGITHADLYVEGLNFVFGEADPSCKTALMSLIRLRPESYGLPPNERLLVKRASTEAMHELGHTFGLGHCRYINCVMYFSNSVSDTDRKGDRFCPKCEEAMRHWRTHYGEKPGSMEHV